MPGGCRPADAGSDEAGGRKMWCSINYKEEWRESVGRSSREQRYCLLKKCAPRVFAPEKFAPAFFSVCRLNFVLLFLAAGAAFPEKTKQKR